MASTSIYEAMLALGTQCAAITTPSAPSVRILPPGHEEDRPSARPGQYWINLTPGQADYTDEPNYSRLTTYTVRLSAWYSVPTRNISSVAQALGSVADGIVEKLRHNTLGGWARYGLSADDIGPLTFSGAGVDDAYLVQGDVRIHRQDSA